MRGILLKKVISFNAESIFGSFMNNDKRDPKETHK